MALNWFKSENLDPALQASINATSLKDSVFRAGVFSYIVAFAFGTYGFMSIDYVSRYNPAITTWNNTWPRLLFNTLPALLLALFLKKSKWSDRTKLFVWITGFASIVHTSAWIHVWPIALSGKSEILAYVDAANVYLVALLFTIVAPPLHCLPLFSGIFFAIFAVPLFVVAHRSGDPVTFGLIVNDTLFTFFSGVTLSAVIHNLRVRIARLEMERATDVKKFLGPTVSKALYEDRKDLLKRRTRAGFILCIDIRGYTGLVQNSSKPMVDEFLDRYHSMVSTLVSKYGGTVHKTAGDGHLISFGILDERPDLSDIPGLESELSAAESNRNKSLLEGALSCMRKITEGACRLAEGTGLPSDFRLGAAIDFGEVEVKLVGDGDHRQELDIFGTPIIRCTRLENYTKAIVTTFVPNATLLILSPEASQFVVQTNGFQIVKTDDKPVRDFPDVKWVLVKEFRPVPALGRTSRRAA